MLTNALIIMGTTSLALLWGFAALGGVMTMWDTFGGYVEEMIMRFKR